MSRVRILEWLLAGVVAAIVAVSFLPWGLSGSVGRSSYELVDSSRSLGLLDEGTARIAPAWFGLPFVAAATVGALATGRRRLAGVLGIAIGLAVLGAALIVKSSPVGVDTGAIAGALLGPTTVVVGAVLLIPERGARRDRRADRSHPDGAARAGRPDHPHAEPAGGSAHPSDADGPEREPSLRSR